MFLSNDIGAGVCTGHLPVGAVFLGDDSDVCMNGSVACRRQVTNGDVVVTGVGVTRGKTGIRGSALKSAAPKVVGVLVVLPVYVGIVLLYKAASMISGCKGWWWRDLGGGLSP